ncbi:MAG: glutamine-synthetase adenylyltransferase [Paracoccaceae bacterium]
MTFAARISRSPRAFDPDRGAEARALVPGAPPELAEVLEGAGGSSPFLMSLMLRDTDWLARALSGQPEDALDAVLADAGALDGPALGDGLRLAKRRVALLVALCDLAGVWTLEDVTGALTRFADLAVERAITTLVGAEIKRGKLPGVGADAIGTTAGMSVLAMGKMGAGELNYSSDIDLICLFDESRFDPEDYAEARSSFIRATRRMAAMLSDQTGAGYVFRTDLRLRPDPSVTPVCLSMDAAENYYESVGRTWERAAYIKARVCAGDIAAGEGFLQRLTPFVWRKHLDFAAIQDAHDMRLRIREHKGFHGPITLEGHNMKLGAGGIREIEFFTQTRQIIAGGRDPDLRVRGTVEGLARLAQKGWVPHDAAQVLTEDYRTHREIEHRLQMVNDAQTHDLPKTPEGFARIAALCGRDVADLREDVLRRLTRVEELTEGFFTPRERGEAPQELSTASQETISRWRSYPALRSDRAVAIFERLKPDLLARLQKAARPDEAIAQFDRFLAGLPAGVQVFSLFNANPQLIDLIVDIAATAPGLALYLGHNAQVFDAVIGGGFFAPWPGTQTLTQELTSRLSDLDDYEAKLDAARRWTKEWHFRIGVHHLRALIDANEAGAQYAALADAVLTALWPVIVAEFSAKHGAPPGQGAVLIGMGSLGSERLNAASDLDLIVIYDAQGVEASDGRRPLPSRTYYARLTQALVTAVTAPMAEGRLYEIDMRLRPSGRQGPVATSFSAFRDYQKTEAWTWEHLALTRARPITGDPDLARAVEAFRQELLSQPSDPAKVLADVAEMRERIAAAKPAKGEWEAKLGAGRIQDVELLAQAAALLAGDPARQIPDQLAAGERIGWLSKSEVSALSASYQLMWHLQSAARLLTGDILDLDLAGRGGTDFVLRETGADDIAALAEELQSVSARAADVIDKALGRVPDRA